MNAPQSIIVPDTIGASFAGGILLGRYFNGMEPRALVGASKLELERPCMAWGPRNGSVSGALSLYDGLANTRAMAEAGSPAARWAQGLRLGGFEDWHLAARGQSLLAFDAHLAEEEKFNLEAHWTSTQYAGDERFAWYQNFGNGNQFITRKDGELRLFAVRSVPI